MCYGAFNVRFAIYLVVLLSGCATQTYWERVADPAKEVIVHTVSVSPWPNVQGWTVRDEKTGVCHILLVENTANRGCVLAHERKHCEGWDHPNHRYNLSC